MISHGNSVHFANRISPPSDGVRITRQNTAFSISGFSIISSFRESLKVRRCAGNEFVKAVAYNDVSSALCLHQHSMKCTSADTAAHQVITDSTFHRKKGYTAHICQSTSAAQGEKTLCSRARRYDRTRNLTLSTSVCTITVRKVRLVSLSESNSSSIQAI
jgi:hypothetical protein